MQFGHVVVWLDQSEARVIRFNREESKEQDIKAVSHRMKRRADAKGDSSEHTHYLDEVALALTGTDEILIVGPGTEKLWLAKHLMKRHHETSEKIVGVETVDHPDDSQLLAYARKYFHRVDQMR